MYSKPPSHLDICRNLPEKEIDIWLKKCSASKRVELLKSFMKMCKVFKGKL